MRATLPLLHFVLHPDWLPAEQPEQFAGVAAERAVRYRLACGSGAFLPLSIMRQPPAKLAASVFWPVEGRQHREQLVTFAALVSQEKELSGRHLDLARPHGPALARVVVLSLVAVQVQ